MFNNLISNNKNVEPNDMFLCKDIKVTELTTLEQLPKSV